MSRQKRRVNDPSVGRYITGTMIPGEDLHAVGTIHWAYIVKPVLFAIGGICFLAYLRSVFGASGALFFLLFLVCFVPLLVSSIYIVTTESAVTSRRVLFKTGLIARNADEISMQKIETVAVRQGIIGRILDYGTVTVRGTGGHGLAIRGIADPMKFREVLQQVIASH